LLLLQVDTGILSLIGNLGQLAIGVLILLAGFSIFAWAIIVDRIWLLRKAERQSEEFTEVFRGSAKFSQVKQACEELDTTPLAGVFMAGYNEISAQLGSARSQGAEAGGAIEMDSLERSLRRAAHKERRQLQRGMLFLATTGAATPFIGLFGTVWGIMNAFHNIGTFGNANLAIVAPGISEALITTAAGLAAAIPAVIAYNHLLARVRKLTTDMEDFGLEFLNVVQKTWKGGAR
jgi:biopolymer transport protein TolQ